MRDFLINENDADQRLDKYIQKTCKKMPKSLMYRLIRQKKIKVNRKRSEPNAILQKGDQVQMFISDEFFSDEKMDLSRISKLNGIIYEDEHFLILDKKTGIIVHSNEKFQEDTLIDQVLKYLIDTHQYDPYKENSFTPAFANRLDQNTGGLIIACKNAKSLRLMNEMIRSHQVEKHYLCIIEGKIKDGLYKHYYIKDEEKNEALIFDEPRKNSVEVSLGLQTLHQGKEYALLDVHLISGKSHQIRAQLAHLHHPLIGDVKYHGKKIMKHQALYAYKLSFHTKEAGFEYLNSVKIVQKNNFVIQKYKNLENVEVEID